MRPRAVAVAAVAWVVVVAVGSTLVWQVVRRVGETVTTAGSARAAPPNALWDKAPGRVVATCRGTTVRLLEVRAGPGYVVEDRSGDAERRRVEFVRVEGEDREDAEDGQDGARVRLTVTCVDGEALIRSEPGD